MNIDLIEKKLLILAKKATKKGEIPVSAIVIHNNKIIAEAYNKREKKKSVLAHAEILVLEKATKKLKRWNLSDCSLYISLKPCSMCQEVIKQSRIKEVYYMQEKPEYKREYYKTKFDLCGSLKFKDSYQQLLANFFQNMR